MAVTEVPEQHRGDKIGGVGRVFGDVIGGEGLLLLHWDTVRGADEEVQCGGASRAMETDLESDRVRAGLPSEGHAHQVRSHVQGGSSGWMVGLS